MATAYWNNRAILRQAAYDRANNQTVATVTKAYDRAMNQLDIDIDKIMATYTRKTGLTARDAYAFLRDGVPPGVMDDLRSRAAAITDKAQAKQLGVMLRTDAYRARISRLDAIKASTRVGLTEAAEAELQAITPHLRHTADLAYSRTMFDIQKVTAGFEMVGVPRKALDTILKSRWSGMNYAQSVWANRDAMAGILDRALMEQASMGKLSQITFDNVRGIVDSKAWADKVAAGMKSKFRDEMQYSKYAANRLIRTESAYVAGQTTAVAYDECEIERYEFMATLDNRTSTVCAGLDGKIFNTADKEVGVNWNPMHPHCRSTTAPVIDGLVREGLTRAARDKDGKSVYVPRDMKYQEWQAWQKDGAPADVKAWRLKKSTGNDKVALGINSKGITPEMGEVFKRYTTGEYKDVCDYSQYLADGTVAGESDPESYYYKERLAVISEDKRKEAVKIIETIKSQQPTTDELVRIEAPRRKNGEAFYQFKEGDEFDWGIRSTTRDTNFAEKVFSGKDEGVTVVKGYPYYEYRIVGKKKALDIAEYSPFDQKESLVCGKYKVKSVKKIIQEPDRFVDRYELAKIEGLDVEPFMSKSGKAMVKIGDKTYPETSARQKIIKVESEKVFERDIIEIEEIVDE